MKPYFAYIRVSTVRQGVHGSSLQEQRDAINIFALRHGLSIASWFEERETAAKTGRHQFELMLAALKRGKASGVIFHKIDRSARNLRDWSTVQELAEHGIDVRFTQESINLGSNEGKLTGDILAAISSHYVRNLRDEVRKGMQGRLKQGIYPLAAPIGYLDQGSGKAKIPDPQRAPLITIAFELYATGNYSLRTVAAELAARGLRGKAGNGISTTHLQKMLRNPFYTGIIRMKRSGEIYAGAHQPIVSAELFDYVQRLLDGKANAKIIRHDFLFRRMIGCATCRYRLIGERRKGHIYYRCHTTSCPTVSITEELAETAIRRKFLGATIPDDMAGELTEMVAEDGGNAGVRREENIRALNLRLQNTKSRISRLTEIYLDDGIEPSLYNEKRLSLLLQRKELEAQIVRANDGTDRLDEEISEFLGRAKSLGMNYEMGNFFEKRDLLKSATSDIVAQGKNVVVELRSPFREIEKELSLSSGGPVRNRPRTSTKKIYAVLVEHFKKQRALDEAA